MDELFFLHVPDLNNTWHLFFFFTSVFDVTLFDRWQGSKGECKGSHGAVKEPWHKSDPHRNEVLTLTVQSKGQPDVTGIWGGERQTGRETAKVHDVLKASVKTLLDMSKALLTHCRLFHDLIIAPWRFVNQTYLNLCCVYTAKDSTSNKWEVCKHGYRLECFILAF